MRKSSAADQPAAPPPRTHTHSEVIPCLCVKCRHPGVHRPHFLLSDGQLGPSGLCAFYLLWHLRRCHGCSTPAWISALALGLKWPALPRGQKTRGQSAQMIFHFSTEQGLVALARSGTRRLPYAACSSNAQRLSLICADGRRRSAETADMCWPADRHHHASDHAQWCAVCECVCECV